MRQPGFLQSIPPLTLVLIIVSVMFSLVSAFGQQYQVYYPFFITLTDDLTLPEVRQGEVWRLITPIFLHFGVIHIAFNMLWLFDLGAVLERLQGTPRLALLVGVIGVLSNYSELLWSHWQFGGMSGVVYGLLGYVWIQGRLNPRFGLVLHNYIVVMMLIWFVVCWLGLVGPIANMAHTVGLLSGLLLGWLFSPRKAFPRL